MRYANMFRRRNVLDQIAENISGFNRKKHKAIGDTNVGPYRIHTVFMPEGKNQILRQEESGMFETVVYKGGIGNMHIVERYEWNSLMEAKRGHKDVVKCYKLHYNVASSLKGMHERF